MMGSNYTNSGAVKAAGNPNSVGVVVETGNVNGTGNGPVTTANPLPVAIVSGGGGGGGGSGLVETLWTDDSGAFYVRIDTGGTITWATISGATSSAPGTGARPASGASVVTDRAQYQATAAGTGYSIGDLVDHFIVADPSSGAIVGSFWFNITTAAAIAAPSSANISPLSPLPTGAATAANQTTEISSLSTVATAQGASGTGISQPTGGSGILGWLSGIFNKLSGTLAVSVAASALASGAAVDGWDSTKGAKADAAYAGSGSASLVAILKGIYAACVAATPAGSNLIGSVTVAPSTTDVAVTPTVTASAYTAGNVIGGILTFANVLAATSFNGILHSITAKFKGAAVTGSIEVAIFKASPSNGTYTDKAAPTWNAADMANLVGIYTLSTPNSKLGTMTVYNLDAIGKAIVGASQSLYAIAIVDGTPTPASTSDFTLELAVLPG